MKLYLNFAFKAKTYVLSVCLLLLGISCKKKEEKQPILAPEEQPTDKLEKLYKEHLVMAYRYLDSITIENSTTSNKEYYVNSRTHFKKSEPILAYAEKENYKSLNAPNLLRIQEEDATDIKINQPIGYQVIEENLLSKTTDTLLLTRALSVTSNRLKLIHNNTQLQFKNHHVLWLLKDAIVRTATVGLSNFDSPVLGMSLEESAHSIQTLKNIISIYGSNFKDKNLLKQWHNELHSTIKALNTDFDTFNRYDFIKNHTNNQLHLLVKTQKDWKVKFPFELALKNDITSLFSTNTFNIGHFSDYRNDTIHLQTKTKLGKALFNDKRLSINNSMSCATCHIQEKAFTDGKRIFNKHQKRNTPTLTYASFQKSFFFDNRAGSLEGQIVGVVTNHNEFNADLVHITNVIKNDKNYAVAFDSLYTRGATDMNIRHAMASYVRSLSPFNSKFDKNINQIETTLTDQEIKGFNLFMGKAACATCHFPPLFNGTVPPYFNESELEIIGVPETKNNKKLDDDLGRYYLFKTEQRKGAFKTPTIRNIALTAPYMHNGVYDTLEEVIDFYNKGGGVGLGFNVPHQTLPFEDLDLSINEQKTIIAFMKTLTDNTSVKYD